METLGPDHDAVHGGAVPGPAHNADAPWDLFDSESYFAHNYRTLRHDDRRIVEIVRDYFATAGIAAGVRGIDVGTGPNLYPALGMLPFCEAIDLYEFSAHNIAWLTAQRAAAWPSWDDGLGAFWDLYAAHPAYRAPHAAVRARLAEITTIVRGSVFDLERAPERRYGLGTMFFVAESLSDDRAEFELAVDRFLAVLAPGAPFAAAFMEGSQGYVIDGVRFPATFVDATDVEKALKRGAVDLRIERIGTDGLPLRPGYSGMIVAVGRAVGAP